MNTVKLKTSSGNPVVAYHIVQATQGDMPRRNRRWLNYAAVMLIIAVIVFVGWQTF